MTIHHNGQIVEKGTRADVKLCGLAEHKCTILGLAKCKCAFWFVMVVACDNPLELRLIVVGICHWFLELLVAAIGWSISSSIPGWSTKDSGSYLLWSICQISNLAWKLCILPWLTVHYLSFLWWKFAWKLCFQIHLLVGLQIGLQLGSFGQLLIGCHNWIKWMTQTWFPATELRAFAWVAKRKSANSTKNLERAVIAFNPFCFQCFNWFFKCSQCSICLCDLAKTWVW